MFDQEYVIETNVTRVAELDLKYHYNHRQVNEMRSMHSTKDEMWDLVGL